MQRTWQPDGPLDLQRTLGPLRHGPRDPTQRVERDGTIWRATRTPLGPATLRLRQDGLVHAEAWGPGAEWVLDGVPELAGEPHDVSFDHPVLAKALRRHPGVRIPRTRRVFEALVPAVIEQKVTGQEAFAAIATLTRRYGEPAPGPAPVGLVVPPAPETWGLIPSWHWHKAGVDPRRTRTVLAAAKVANRLEETVTMGHRDAQRRLTAVPGIGVWTAAEVGARALGDTDALSVGDFHVAAHVGWALLGRPIDDAEMVALLEPWRPYRAVVIRLIELSGIPKPRFGPRMTIQDHRAH